MNTETAGWTPVMALADLPDQKAVRVVVDDVDVLVCRNGETLYALANKCTHVGGPLHKGVLKAAASMPTVTCPVHGSIFRLTDGRVVRGPASRPQTVYETRVTDGTIEVRPKP